MAIRTLGAQLTRQPRRVLLYLSLLLVLAVLVLAALTFLYDPQPPVEGQQTGEPPALVVGAPAPELQLRTLDGGEFKLSALKGRPVWLNFWSTTCAPCEEELPHLITVGREAEQKNNVRLLAVDVGEDASAVRAYLRRTGYESLPVALDEEFHTAAAYKVYYMPSHVFLDSNGIVRRVETAQLSAAQMRDAVADLR